MSVRAPDHHLGEAAGFDERGIQRIGGAPAAGPVAGKGSGEVVEGHFVEDGNEVGAGRPDMF